MEKQTVYIPVDVKESNYALFILEEPRNDWRHNQSLEKKENVYVFTSQEFEKLIGDAFNAGWDYNESVSKDIDDDPTIIHPPNKTEYLNNLNKTK